MPKLQVQLSQIAYTVNGKRSSPPEDSACLRSKWPYGVACLSPLAQSNSVSHSCKCLIFSRVSLVLRTYALKTSNRCFLFLFYVIPKKKMRQSCSMYSELLSIQQNARLATFQMFIIVCNISFLGSFCLLNVQQYFVFWAVKEFFNDHKY